MDESGGIKDWIKRKWDSLFTKQYEFKFKSETVEKYILPTKPLNLQDVEPSLTKDIVIHLGSQKSPMIVEEGKELENLANLAHLAQIDYVPKPSQ